MFKQTSNFSWYKNVELYEKIRRSITCTVEIQLKGPHKGLESTKICCQIILFEKSMDIFGIFEQSPHCKF